ncbi:hypothetical protein DFP95_13913 [Cohnella lupini]|uniref:Uncharacterized protein n=1 Tax=Cohnella lupini TaxID=1294267 RepID=A0A3D9HSC4_9BACL|nr:hypothetical protein DFP95_13913 [Cohnella lupini]
MTIYEIGTALVIRRRFFQFYFQFYFQFRIR